METASLIIPFYKQKNNLSIILKSVEYQTFDKNRLEIVLVNDGCDDDITEELETYHHLNIKYYQHETNRGRSAARNTGVKLAQGELLVFIDADRFLEPAFIQQHLASHKQHQNAVVIGEIVEIFVTEQEAYLNAVPALFYEEKHKIWNFARRYNYAECVMNIFNEEGTTASPVPWIAMFSGNFSISKEVYKSVGEFDESYMAWGFENMDFGHKLHENGIIYLYNKNAINFHIFHKQDRQMENNSSLKYFQEKFSQNKNMLNYLQFLDGSISLRDLDGTGSDKIPDLYYNREKLGSRYRYMSEKNV